MSRVPRRLLTTALLLTVCNGLISGNWMYLSLKSVSKDGIVDCNSVSNLNAYNFELCRSKPHAFRIVGFGIQIAIDECKRQFRRERWNCPTSMVEKSKSVFGHVLDRGTKETAFIHAITSAGVAFSITKSCSRGMFPDCDKCDKSKKGHVDKSGEWKWDECNDNVNEGLRFAEKVTNPTEKCVNTIGKCSKRCLRRTMKLHNNRAGRLALVDSMMSVCSCTGVSGSCATRVCRRILPSFKIVGERMKMLYANAVKMPVNRRGKKQIREAKNLMVKQLLYMNKSPNFCFPNPDEGVPGTSGRVCNITSSGMDSCSLLCCGQGYNIQIRRNIKKCNCKFKWCCNVDCDTCESLEKVQTCK